MARDFVGGPKAITQRASCPRPRRPESQLAAVQRQTLGGRVEPGSRIRESRQVRRSVHGKPESLDRRRREEIEKHRSNQPRWPIKPTSLAGPILHKRNDNWCHTIRAGNAPSKLARWFVGKHVAQLEPVGGDFDFRADFRLACPSADKALPSGAEIIPL